MAKPDELPEDERIPEPNLDDDETVQDPVNETDEDAGDDPDDQDDDAGGQDDQQPEPAARQSRGDRQFAELRRRAQQEAQEKAELTRQLAEMRGELTALRRPAQQSVETPQQRADRLALMSPEERADVIVSERLAAHEQRQQMLTNQLLDQSDRTSFEAIAATNPLFKKLSSEVERRRAVFVQAGQGVPPRATIATYLIGERVLEQQGKGRPAAAQRRRQQQARPANGGGDTPNPRRERQRGDVVSSFEAKYGDMEI